MQVLVSYTLTNSVELELITRKRKKPIKLIPEDCVPDVTFVDTLCANRDDSAEDVGITIKPKLSLLKLIKMHCYTLPCINATPINTLILHAACAPIINTACCE